MGRRLAKRHRRSPCRAQEVSAEFLAPPQRSCIAVGNSPIPTSLLYLQAPHSWLRSAMKSPILLLSQRESVSKHLSRHTHQVKAPLLKIVRVSWQQRSHCRQKWQSSWAIPSPARGIPAKVPAGPRRSWARGEPAHRQQEGSEDAVSQDR